MKKILIIILLFSSLFAKAQTSPVTLQFKAPTTPVNALDTITYFYPGKLGGLGGLGNLQYIRTLLAKKLDSATNKPLIAKINGKLDSTLNKALITGAKQKNDTSNAQGYERNWHVANLLAGKQATLVSGTNIKTVNSTSLLGSGDIPFPTSLPTPFAATFNNSGSGAASGTTFDGSTARTISYNTIGAQPSGNYITGLTGDGTASGPGSAALTLATVNANIGSFGTASNVPTITYNGKGLATSVANTPIQIAESQVTNLPADLAATVKYTDTAALQAKNTLQKITTNGDSTTNTPKMAKLHVGGPPNSNLHYNPTFNARANASIKGGLKIFSDPTYGEALDLVSTNENNSMTIQSLTAVGPTAIAFIDKNGKEIGAIGFQQATSVPGIYTNRVWLAGTYQIDPITGIIPSFAKGVGLLQEGYIGGVSRQHIILLGDSDMTTKEYNLHDQITRLQDTTGNQFFNYNVNLSNTSLLKQFLNLDQANSGLATTAVASGSYSVTTSKTGTGTAPDIFLNANGASLLMKANATNSIFSFNYATTSTVDPYISFSNPSLANGNAMTFKFGKDGTTNGSGVLAYIKDPSTSSFWMTHNGDDFGGSGTGLAVWKGGQMSVGQKNIPNASALVTFKSTTQMFLEPVMTGTQFSNISSKIEGGQAYLNSTHKMVYQDNAVTRVLLDSARADARFLQLTGGDLTSGAQLNINNGAIANFGSNQTTAPSSYWTSVGLKIGTTGNLTHNFTSYNNNNISTDNGTTAFTINIPQNTSGTFALTSQLTSGTVTSITPGYGFTSSTPITTAGTLTIDTTKLTTRLNLTPLVAAYGDGRWAKLGSSNTFSGASNTFNSTTVFGSGATFNSAITMNQQIVHNGGYQDVYYNLANTFNAVFGVNTLTGNRTATLPDKDGTLVVSTQLPIHGNSTTTGTATTVVTVTIGSTMANTSYNTTITPRDLLTAVNYYISAQTTTTFDVTFVTALTGSINFDWCVIQ